MSATATWIPSVTPRIDRRGSVKRAASRCVKTPRTHSSTRATSALVRSGDSVLTHPDMDHMDGLSRLVDNFVLHNYWDSGVRRTKPRFDRSPYSEVDWDRYVRIRDGREPGVRSLRKCAGDRFAYANEVGKDGGHDGLRILSPAADLVSDSERNNDVNDDSYVTLYSTEGGRILLPGDAHDGTWTYIGENWFRIVRGSAFSAGTTSREGLRSVLRLPRPCPAVAYADWVRAVGLHRLWPVESTWTRLHYQQSVRQCRH